ncbi:Glycoside hydrolase, family 14 [Corchorus capsularis]|uniref:Beta-amylase n=1 Tax=Corchorus capsularis TaxID=210143 RepID=A0A1R3J949_COCAP|nr:Glycoside hydrolase, family 14 [Corchorus capsularis]
MQNPQSSNNANQDPTIDAQPQPRRPRGFAATAAAAAASGSPTGTSSGAGAASTGSSSGKGKREREKEKERTKLRERHRRAITSRMLAGLRQYGNFPLPARADMNDVLAALAREAGWTVEPDGTTYRLRHSPPAQPQHHQHLGAFPVRSVESPLSSSSLKNCSVKATLDCQPPVVRIDESLSPASLDSVVIAERDTRSEKYPSASPINSVECLEADQLIQDVHSVEHENDFTGTQDVPVYIKLSTGVINNFCQVADPESIRQELSHLKSLNVDGVIVDCWWGIIENWNPQKYVWSGYRELFNIIREFNMKIQVVMAFHEYGGTDSANVLISLPQWILEIGKENQDIFFTDREGRRTTECLSWGIDKERVLNGRTGIEVYFDFMRSFRTEFDDLFAESLFSAVEIGLGPSGELRYPSFSERMGWRYPGIGEFQCYDKYLQQNLRKAAKLRGHSFWARGPDNAGQYNSRPHETGFFCERGDYDSYYGRFFLQWYAQSLIDHADNVLSLASLAFDETKIIVKVPAVYWWYKTSSHAAELTAGYYNPTNQDGYSPVFEVLKKHSVTMKFVCSGLQVCSYESDEAFADPEGLSWQVLNSAWDRGLTVAGENTLSCFDREGCLRIIETAKPRNDPDRRHFSFFVYQQPSPLVQGVICFPDLDYFIKCMHGDITGDLGPQ